MSRTVVLLHETPGDSSHFDWLIGPDGPDEGLGPDARVVRGWRLPEVPRSGARVSVVPLPPHRLLYLHYEGPVRDLGRVRRVASGTVRGYAEDADGLEVLFDLGGGHLRCVGVRSGRDSWVFRFEGV